MNTDFGLRHTFIGICRWCNAGIYKNSLGKIVKDCETGDCECEIRREDQEKED